MKRIGRAAKKLLLKRCRRQLRGAAATTPHSRLAVMRQRTASDYFDRAFELVFFNCFVSCFEKAECLQSWFLQSRWHTNFLDRLFSGCDFVVDVPIRYFSAYRIHF